MRQIKVALGLIKQGDNYLLQLRGDNPAIGGAGLIGCFGGKIDDNEDPKKTVCREIAEETTLNPIASKLQDLGRVNVKSDHKLEQVKVEAHIYKIDINKRQTVKAREGKILKMSLEDAKSNLDKLTPATKVVFTELL